MTDKLEGIIFDLDGVLEYQEQVLPGAVELIDSLRANQIPVRILSNSTLKSRRTCTEKLNRKGFSISEEEVVTASFATAQYLAALNPGPCWVMLDGDGLEEFRNFRQDTENPEYLIIGDFREGFNFQNMNKALYLLQKGVKLIVMITEKVDHSMGQTELTVGAYGQMLEDAAGIKAVYIGKPNHYVFDITLGSMGNIDRDNILMVGDRISTDILGGKGAGLKTALVRTGEFRESDLESPIAVPDYILDSVADIGKLFS